MVSDVLSIGFVVEHFSILYYTGTVHTKESFSHTGEKMHNTYKETLTVWPVNDATGLHLFSTPEAAETYADEHQGDMLEPMPVMCQPEPSGIAWD